MGRFAGIEKATPSEGGVWVLPGVYDVKVRKCKAGTSRKKADFFVAEVEVIASDNPQRPVGCVMSWMVTLKEDTPALGDIRAFVATCEGSDISQVGEEEVEYAASEANPEEGKLLHLIATNIKLKSGGDFTKCKWEPYEGEAEAATG